MTSLLTVQTLYVAIFGFWRSRLRPLQHYIERLYKQNLDKANRFYEHKRAKELEVALNCQFNEEMDYQHSYRESLMDKAQALRFQKSKLRPKLPTNTVLDAKNRNKRQKQALNECSPMSFKPNLEVLKRERKLRKQGRRGVENLLEELVPSGSSNGDHASSVGFSFNAKYFSGGYPSN